ncbi:formamidopyrimidine-DNA glycosylase [Bacillus cereus]|uniref:Formamidopyrimidine-DNA glycosylase n=1 Tax=Bacillus cereus TaxID=1396 RepID=A0A2C1M8I1_BACCE|nr:formamidopyrimidine-DNA glycosylase [Bacillus cereus]PGU06724.1 formamidopyrimidine-DNA glycosylase [Bacillus cereus]
MKQNNLYQSYQRSSLPTNERNINFSNKNNTSLLHTIIFLS